MSRRAHDGQPRRPSLEPHHTYGRDDYYGGYNLDENKRELPALPSQGSAAKPKKSISFMEDRPRRDPDPLSVSDSLEAFQKKLKDDAKPVELKVADLRRNPIECVEYFGRLQGSSAIDLTLRTRHQQIVEHYAMAETKANMLITVASIVLSFVVAQLVNSKASYTLITFSFFTIVSLGFAVMSVIPSYSSKITKGNKSKDIGIALKEFNILDFEHYSKIPLDTFMDNIGLVIQSDQNLYAAMTRDIYLGGKYLAHFKYAWLRRAYMTFTVGVMVSLVVYGATAVMGATMDQGSNPFD